MEETLVYERLGCHGQSVKELTRLENVLVCEQVLAHKLSKLIGGVLDGHLWMRHTQCCWGSKQFGGHYDALGVLVKVGTLVAQLREFGQDNTTNEDLLRPKGISQGRIFGEDIPELVDDVESLEDCVDAVVPADLSFCEVSISVE